MRALRPGDRTTLASACPAALSALLGAQAARDRARGAPAPRVEKVSEAAVRRAGGVIHRRHMPTPVRSAERARALRDDAEFEDSVRRYLYGDRSRVDSLLNGEYRLEPQKGVGNENRT